MKTESSPFTHSSVSAHFLRFNSSKTTHARGRWKETMENMKKKKKKPDDVHARPVVVVVVVVVVAHPSSRSYEL